MSVYDGTESFCKKYGALYLIDEAWYYINYDTLENDKFDADGNFSYRRGTVELSKLSDELAKKIDIANDSKDILYTVYTYEEDEFVEDFEHEYFDESFGVALFWVVFSLVCLALPAFIAVGAFIVARLDKLGRPKYWYIVSLIALVWIVSSVALMIIILI